MNFSRIFAFILLAQCMPSYTEPTGAFERAQYILGSTHHVIQSYITTDHIYDEALNDPAQLHEARRLIESCLADVSLAKEQATAGPDNIRLGFAYDGLTEDLQTKRAIILSLQEVPSPRKETQPLKTSKSKPAKPIAPPTITIPKPVAIQPEDFSSPRRTKRSRPRAQLASVAKRLEFQSQSSPSQSGGLLDDFLQPSLLDTNGWQIYDENLWLHGANKPPFFARFRTSSRKKAPQAPKSSKTRLLGWQSTWGSSARAITQTYPQAQPHEYKLINIKAARQNGNNCGYHAHCNGHAITVSLLLNQAPWQILDTPHLASIIRSTRLPSTAFIEREKAQQNREASTQSVLDAQELTRFAAFDLTHYQPIMNEMGQQLDIFQNPTFPGLYWGNLEYIQARLERDSITQALEFFYFIRHQPRDINVFKNLYHHATSFGEQFSHPGITMDHFYNLLEYKNLINKRSLYLDPIRAFRAGKTLVLSWLDHPGKQTDIGHWSCLCFIPEKTNPSHIQPDHVTVLNIDSLNKNKLSPDAKRFIWDLLHLELPNPYFVNEIENIFSPIPYPTQ